MNLNIALLATGDEIVEGDVINTASPAIAQILKPLGLITTAQLACDDQQSQIVDSLHYLLNEHDIIIITGGLGPTCDDRTRYALATVINEELVLDQTSWDRVYQHILKHRGFVPDNNKQQSLFPKSAVIIENTTGTADGCHVTLNDKHIFMLPGPPSQSIPMVENYIKPFLEKAGYTRPGFRKSWMLLDVSESHLATLVDEALLDTNLVEVGYRFNPPYLQFKLKSDNKNDLMKAELLLEPILKPYIWREGNQTALEILKQTLTIQKNTYYIEDKITNGHLNSYLVDKYDYKTLCFAPNHIASDYTIKISADTTIFDKLITPTYRFEYKWHLLITKHDQVILDKTITQYISQQFAMQSICEWTAIYLLQQLHS